MSTEEPGNARSPLLKDNNKTKSWFDKLGTRWGIILLGGISILSIVFAVAGGLYLFVFQKNLPGPQLVLTPPPSLEELIEEYPELEAILTDARLDSVVKDFLIAYQDGGPEAAYDLAKQRGLLNKNDDLVLTLELDTTNTAFLKAELETNGIIVATVSGNLMDIVVPMELIQESIESGNPAGLFEDITGLEHIIRIKIPIPYQSDGSFRIPIPVLYTKGLSWPLMAGNVDIESLAMIGATNWHQAGFTGRGIKIGILDSGGFDRYQELLGTELPAIVLARTFVYGGQLGNSGGYYGIHGTGCAEIIHDIAPDAELVFAEYRYEAEMIQAVDWLMTQGLWIISNSTGGPMGSMDGSSNFAKKVDRVSSSGVLWVNSAGNLAEAHYRGTFKDQNGDGFHEFETGNQLLGFVTPAGSDVILTWDDWQVGDQDFNLYIYDAEGKVVASSENIQNGPGSDSIENLTFSFAEGVIYYAAFYAVRVTHQAVFDFFVLGEVEYPVPEYSLGIPADAHGSFSVAAVNWENDRLEDYSSQGPTADGRLKPDIAAPTSVAVVSRDKPFNGTSGAAPHVSGAAALVWSVFPNYTNQQIIEFLEKRAIDLGASGPDNAFGYGRLWLGTGPESSAPLPSPEAIPTHSDANTSTPTRPQTATPSTSDASESNVSLGLFLCVALPGLVGVGGIGLLGVMFMKRYKTAGVGEGNEGALITTPDYPVQLPVIAIPPCSGPSLEPEVTQVVPEVEEREICPHCGIAHRPNIHFCPVCGFKLKHDSKPAKEITYCIYCGKNLLPDNKFCYKCGKPTGH